MIVSASLRRALAGVGSLPAGLVALLGLTACWQLAPLHEVPEQGVTPECPLPAAPEISIDGELDELGPVVRAPTAPPPISGGTLEVSPDGSWVVAADPDRYLVYVVAAAARS